MPKQVHQICYQLQTSHEYFNYIDTHCAKLFKVTNNYCMHSNFSEWSNTYATTLLENKNKTKIPIKQNCGVGR
jgi:hypothetical protein